MEEQFKIGDTLFSESRYHGLKPVTIKRFTNTTIVLNDGAKIRKPFTEGCTAIGTSGFGNTYYYTYTPKKESDYKRQQHLLCLSRFNFKSLSNDTLDKLIQLLTT